MDHQDTRGNPCSSASSDARAAVEQALWRMMSFYDTPLADLDAASAADSGWALPHIMKAGFLASLTEPALLPQAAAHLRDGELLLDAQTVDSPGRARETAHLQAVRAAVEGRWWAACRIWDELIVEHPRDALALQWAQLWDFYRGDTAGLRARPAGALRDWDSDDPLYAHVLALHAFGLEENNLHGQAEEAGRRALELCPRSPWAIHAVAHVMEMQGRFEAGAAWLRQHHLSWAEGNGFSTHLWWHLALFRLEAMDTPGVLRLVDAHLSGPALQISLQRVDAASLLWRLHLMRQDVSAHCRELAQGWGLLDGTPGDVPASSALEAGHYAFNDLHAVLALLGADEVARAEGWVARCARRVLDPGDAASSNHQTAREVGLPLMRGLCLLAHGDGDGALALLASARAQASQLGGSHAQRDLIDQTVMAAAARRQRHQGAHHWGRALLNQRRLAKPETPLTRFWIEELGLSSADRA